MNFYPLKFKPIYKELIWGGYKLRNILGKDFPAEKKIGESWELADLPNDKTVITNGEFAGKTLSELLLKYSEQITGQKNYQPPFGLLIKFIDAADILSVQVHPDNQAVKKLKMGHPKTECWYIISAEPNSCIYKGLKAGITKEQFAQSIKGGTCAELLNKVPVKPGQCHFLPAGTVHAIGAGILIAEIQTPSDTTFRVFDWNRLQDGKPRQIHIEQALESINFNQKAEDLPVTTSGRLADNEFFKIDKITAQAGTCEKITKGTMKVIIIISGSGQIISKDSDSVDFAKGQTILLPAVFEGEILFASNTEYLSVTQ
ncbi:MAG: class I mannose-6-phosphate isomerase [Planctomycetes bacterium]|nr:class I mannose-6-phosphate isomerase [Planctomycetota bacterium]MBU1518914.1 class I mannose-6-phosphate isomerase [Planctomycetota bacterium]